jgi:hypothetical protein
MACNGPCEYEEEPPEDPEMVVSTDEEADETTEM